MSKVILIVATLQLSNLIIVKFFRNYDTELCSLSARKAYCELTIDIESTIDILRC